MIKFTDETVYRYGYPFGRTVEIVKVGVDFGSTGYNCWGFRLGSEGTLASTLFYSEDWLTPGDALNAAHKERNAFNEG